MPTYINIAPNTKLPSKYDFVEGETYIIPYTSLLTPKIYNMINNTKDIDIIIYTFDFMHITFEILDREQYMKNQIIVSGFDTNNSHKSMQYLSYKAIKKCNNAILFVNSNNYLNDDIYDDINQIQQYENYSHIEIVDEQNNITNITERHQFLAYKYKQYAKGREECKHLLKKYQR